MKRFYEQASVIDGEVRLDGKPVLTPRRNRLALPTPIAGAVAAEWAGQGETIVPRTMPLTQLANGMVDLDAADRARIVTHLAGYAATELLCYRDAANTPLGRAQSEEWESALAEAEARYDVRFLRAEGIMPVAQPAETLARFETVAAAQENGRLVALNALTGGLGSLLLALAVLDGRMDEDTAFALSRLEARFQEETWGEDAEAAAATRRLHEEVRAAAAFARLLPPQPPA